MKDIYKNPILYYVAVPVLVGLWPLLVWAIYLPAAQQRVAEQMDQYKEKGEPLMMEILTLDPARSDSAEPNETDTAFSYSGAVKAVADECGISPANYAVRTGIIVKTAQTANVDLKQVDIAKFAKFLSLIQLRWADLQCESVKLTKKENLPDNNMWDVDIKFKYYY